MNAKSAEQFIQCHCGPGLSSGDASVRKALKFAAKRETLKKELEEQLELDARALKWIDGIALPTDLEQLFLDDEEEPVTTGFNWKAAWRQPPFLALLIALLVLFGWVFTLVRADHFPGRETVQQLIDATEEMTGSELDPKTTETGLLGDWLFSQYGFENFFVPEELSHLKTAGCRVLKLNGIPVAQIAVQKHESFLFVFQADDLGVKINPPDQWRIFEMDDWCVAIQSHEKGCIMLAFHGSQAEMQGFLGR